MKGVLFHQDSAPAHKSVVAIAAMHDCGFELGDHHPCSPDLAPSDYFLFHNIKNSWLGSNIRPMSRSYRSAVEDFFRGSEWKLLFHWNPSTATRMEEVCGGETMLKNKLHLVKFDHYIIVSLWTFQPTLVVIVVC